MLATDPRDERVVYAGADGGLFRSGDRGHTWEPLMLGVSVQAVAVDPSNSAHLPAIDPSDSQTLCASIGDASSRVRPSRLAVSVDGGKHWRFLKSGTHFIQSTALVIDPRDSRTLYAGTRFQGVLRTTDGGATWQPFDTGLLARAIGTLALDRSGAWLYAGTDGAGVEAVRLH